MGRPPSTHEVQVKKGPWTPEEDQMLIDYINEHGDHGKWRGLPKLAGLNRCGKSCRLRWNNYLKPHIKRGKFSEEEEELIISLHSNLGNKWSQIASHLPGRTDNEIKNYWNTRLKKKLLQTGIDPVTHTQRTDLDLLSDLNHLLMSGSNTMNPWDSAIQLQAQLAQIQLLQNLAQLIHMGTAPAQDYRRNEYHLQSGVQFQQLHNMQSFAQTSNITNSYDTLGEFSNNDNRKYQSSNSNSAASTNTTISTTVSGSPESSFVNEIDGKVDPSDISSNYSFEAWGDFNLDDTFWKDILE